MNSFFLTFNNYIHVLYQFHAGGRTYPISTREFLCLTASLQFWISCYIMGSVFPTCFRLDDYVQLFHIVKEVEDGALHYKLCDDNLPTYHMKNHTRPDSMN